MLSSVGLGSPIAPTNRGTGTGATSRLPEPDSDEALPGVGSRSEAGFPDRSLMEPPPAFSAPVPAYPRSGDESDAPGTYRNTSVEVLSPEAYSARAPCPPVASSR